jgi:hypothetical protein
VAAMLMEELDIWSSGDCTVFVFSVSEDLFGPSSKPRSSLYLLEKLRQSTVVRVEHAVEM